MDFISFENAAANRNKASSPHNFKNNFQKSSSGSSMKKSLSFGSPAGNMPAFGSPAVNFGSPAVNFGAPVVQNVSLNRHHSTPHNAGITRPNSTPSPRNHNDCNQQYSPRSYGHNMNTRPHQSPGGSSPRQFSPYGHNMNTRPQQSPGGSSPRQFSPYGNRNNNYMKHSNDSLRQSNDGNGFKTPHQFSPNNRSRGNGRKSFNRQFGQTPRFDSNTGGSLNIEDYYQPCMIEDPWRYSKPVFVKT